MEIHIHNIGKRYHGNWLFRHLEIKVTAGEALSVTGRNGSGKSTLMQIAYGLAQPSEGQVLLNGFESADPHRLFAYSAPYMDLPTDFTALEIFSLYKNAGKCSMETEAFSGFCGFDGKTMQRPLRYYSSGMLQRFKTALCLSSDAPVLMLDEPLSNMDNKGELWYRNCISDIRNKIVIVAGNNPKEYDFANKNIHIQG